MNGCPCANCKANKAPCLWDELRRRAGLMPEPPPDAPPPPRPHTEPETEEEP